MAIKRNILFLVYCFLRDVRLFHYVTACGLHSRKFNTFPISLKKFLKVDGSWHITSGKVGRGLVIWYGSVLGFGLRLGLET